MKEKVKPNSLRRRFPAEWETHRATWIAWPHEEEDFPGKLSAIDWVYTEIVRHLSASEPLEIVVKDEAQQEHVKHLLSRSSICGPYRFHVRATDRSWLRDSMPTGVWRENRTLEWIAWQFNAWAKYDNFNLDRKIPEFVEQVTKNSLCKPVRPDNGAPVVLEGGAIETDGEGTLLVTEECLLSDEQVRNPGLSREGYEQVFREYLGIDKTIWLGQSCEGDDTHGHIDDVARFVAPAKVVLSYNEDPTDPDHAAASDNLRRLQGACDAKGRLLEVVTLPTPAPLYYDDARLPASYANFYIGNSVVLVPTFNDENDRRALETLAKLFPKHKVIGIHAVDLILGYGTLHCLTQQEPRE